MTGVIETKVSLPAIVTLLVGTVSGAVYGVLLAFGLLDPTEAQQTALAALGGALLLVLQTVLAYRAPHTARPDLYAAGGLVLEPVRAVNTSDVAEQINYGSRRL